MTVPDVLLELAERCEEADATFALDLKIFRAIYGEGAVGNLPPCYTSKIDAALRLVPEGYTWTLYGDGCAGVCPKADEDDLAEGDVWAATPALALCAAALRAHAAIEDQAMAGERG